MLAVSRSSITAAKRRHLTIEWDQKVVPSSHTFPVHLAAILPLRRAVFDRYGWPPVAGNGLGKIDPMRALYIAEIRHSYAVPERCRCRFGRYPTSAGSHAWKTRSFLGRWPMKSQAGSSATGGWSIGTLLHLLRSTWYAPRCNLQTPQIETTSSYRYQSRGNKPFSFTKNACH